MLMQLSAGLLLTLCSLSSAGVGLCCASAIVHTCKHLKQAMEHRHGVEALLVLRLSTQTLDCDESITIPEGRHVSIVGGPSKVLLGPTLGDWLFLNHGQLELLHISFSYRQREGLSEEIVGRAAEDVCRWPSVVRSSGNLTMSSVRLQGPPVHHEAMLEKENECSMVSCLSCGTNSRCRSLRGTSMICRGSSDPYV